MDVADKVAELTAPKRERGGGRVPGASCARTARRGSAGPTSFATSRPTTSCRRKTSLRIEATADRILAEIGIEFRDDPAAIAHWKRAGAKVDGVLVKFEPGMLREMLKTAPADFTQHARNPPAVVEIGGKSVVFSPAYGSPFVMDLDKGRRYGTIEDFQQLREAGAVLALAAPFRRHDLRAGRRAGQQAPSRHGLQPHPLFRPRLHGLGDGREPGRGFDRHGAHRLRRRFRRPELRHPRQRQRQLAAGLGRHHDARRCAPMPAPTRRR